MEKSKNGSDEDSMRDQNHISSQFISNKSLNTTTNTVNNELSKTMNGWSSDGIHENKEHKNSCEMTDKSHLNENQRNVNPIHSESINSGHNSTHSMSSLNAKVNPMDRHDIYSSNYVSTHVSGTDNSISVKNSYRSVGASVLNMNVSQTYHVISENDWTINSSLHKFNYDLGFHNYSLDEGIYDYECNQLSDRSSSDIMEVEDSVNHDNTEALIDENFIPFNSERLKTSTPKRKKVIKNGNKNYSNENIQKLVHQSFQHITPQSWKKCVEHVVKVEQKFWENDGIIDSKIDDLIISFNDDSDTESDSSDSETDSDNDHNYSRINSSNQL